MTGQTYRSVGLRGTEIVAVSSERDGLDDLVGSDTSVIDDRELTIVDGHAVHDPAGTLSPSTPASRRYQ
jgi:hypothetical protein